jgi:hypothetical protein
MIFFSCNFLGNDWKPKKFNIELFEALKTTRHALTRNLTELLDQYGLRKSIIAYAKNKGSNLNAMTNVFNFVVWCEILGLENKAVFFELFFEFLNFLFFEFLYLFSY